MTVFLDYDNTLCDLTTPVCEEINISLGLTLECSNKDIKHYGYLQNEYGNFVNDILHSPEIYKRVVPFNGAVDFVNEIKKDNKVVIITSCLNEELYNAKKDHIEEYFGDIPSIMSSEKYKYLSKQDILIDDYLEHVLNHFFYNKGSAILFNYNENFPYVSTHKYNLKYFDKVNYATSYSEVIKRIDDASLSVSTTCSLSN